MSQSNSVSNPFGAGPSGGTPDAQNPFQIVGGGAAQPAAPAPQAAGPSPFEAVGNQGAAGAAQASGEPVRANPFQIAGGAGAAAPERPAAGGQAAQPQAGGGFAMKGLPPGSAPMNQLEAAPVEEGTEAPAPSADPFAGMDFPNLADEPASSDEGAAAREPEAREMEDFSAKERATPATAERAPAAEPERPRAAEVERERAPEAAPAERAYAEPAVAAAPVAVPQAEEVPSARPFVPARPTATKPVTSEMKQLELRAIFGVDHELNQQEILQKARSLPGVLHIAKINAKELAALETLHSCANRLGIDDDQPLVMSCPDGFIDFLSYQDTSLAVLRNENFAPGVRETLIIVARELERL